MNYYLKEVGEECKIEKQLTFNFARHTFVYTILKGNGLATETVNKLTGRKSLNCGKVTDFSYTRQWKKFQRN